MPIKKKRGRPKTPTALAKKLGHRTSRINEKEIKAAPFIIPLAPKTWKQPEIDRYYSAVKMLGTNNLLTAVNIDFVIAYVLEMKTYFDAIEEMRKKGNGKVIKNRYGTPQVNPWHRIQKDSFDTAMKIAREFGFTPSTSAGIQTPQSPENEKDTEFEDV